MKEKKPVIRDVLYTCPKCSKISLVKIGPDLNRCIGCETPQDNVSSTSDNVVACMLGFVGWFMLLFLL